ncbi:glycosyltransferase family 2 protein [Pontibacter pamirensis]|uniref:glycosyltransferase family 2 protein n=1 Tax=Pontibacter pamirensis TaxID=2562824 RepID=UPI001389442D|nr:glycosyltransferase family 2 protein [Pontibacter pamirensis]
MKTAKPAIGVVVLSYNRLPLLRITLQKIMAQTYGALEVLVVDNNSTDGARAYLDTLQDVETLYLSENMGPAGGFHEGIRYFAEKGNVDYIWLMDDDFFPSASCLEALVNATDEQTIAFPYVRDKAFVTHNQPGWWGVLVPMAVVKHVGYPMKEFFFWSEDTEYFQHRMRDKFNYRNMWVQEAKGVHFTERKRDFRQPWRVYYEIRNTTYMRLHVRERTGRRTYKLIKGWVKLAGGIMIKEKEKGEKMKWLLRGVYDGMTKQLGKTVDPLAK